MLAAWQYDGCASRRVAFDEIQRRFLISEFRSVATPGYVASA